MSSCQICQKIKNIQADKKFIFEFKNSYLVLGDHQFFNGYSVLHFKNHVRDVHTLTTALQTELFSELMQSATAIDKAFKPWKINYSCYGNVVEHIHWHIFPRYENDPDLRVHPWLHFKDFDKSQPTEQVIQNNVLAIKQFL
jgi:diadenosine tetraphosphate (Ap4A) HIT family hydrolase